MQTEEVPPSPLTVSFQNRVSMGSSDRKFGPPEITPNDIELHELIGVGSCGSVYRARCRGIEVAVKVPLNQNLTALQVLGFMDEVRMMSNNTHPNIISLLGACIEPGKLQIVTERCTRDLATLLGDRMYNGSLYERLKLAYETAKGMWWLHESSMIHEDLKPSNILLDFHTHVKITDFGFSLFKQDHPIEAPSAKGSLLWMAPEKILRKPITEKIDVYSFGIILWEILTRQKPFQHHTDRQQFCKAVCLDHERPPIPQDIPPGLKELLINCWQHDPAHRHSFKQIVHILSSIMVDISFDVPYAAAFWKRNFIQTDEEYREAVEWQNFKQALKNTTGEVSDDLYMGLEILLVEIVSSAALTLEQVTMQRFDKVSKWFGGFFRDTGQRQIEEINTLMAEPWFHGDIDGTLANSRLSGKANGTFLIRLSSTDPKKAPFTLSLPNNSHYHIRRTPTGISIDGNNYLSLQQFIQAYPAQFTKPCPKIYETRYFRETPK